MPGVLLGQDDQLLQLISAYTQNIAGFVQQYNHNKEGNRLPHHKLPEEPGSINPAAIRATMYLQKSNSTAK